jgi:transposase InsO family protein
MAELGGAQPAVVPGRSAAAAFKLELHKFSGSAKDWDMHDHLFTAACKRVFSKNFMDFTSADAEAEDNYESNNRTFYSLLVSSVSETAVAAHLLLRRFSAADNGRGAFAALRAKYQGNKDVRVQQLRNLLVGAKLGDDEPDAFYMRIDQWTEELRQLEGKGAISDSEKVTYFMRGLPALPLYNNVAMHIRALKISKAEEIVELVQSEYLHDRDVQQVHAAMVAAARQQPRLQQPQAQPFRGVCFGCGEEGHRKADCPRAINNPNKRAGAGATGKWCTHCHVSSHETSTCEAAAARREQKKVKARLAKRKRAAAAAKLASRAAAAGDGPIGFAAVSIGYESDDSCPGLFEDSSDSDSDFEGDSESTMGGSRASRYISRRFGPRSCSSVAAAKRATAQQAVGVAVEAKFDTGANTHIFGAETVDLARVAVSVRNCQVVIETAGDLAVATQVADLLYSCTDSTGEQRELLLRGVLIVPGFKDALISAHRLDKAGGVLTILGDGGAASITVGGHAFPLHRTHGLYALRLLHPQRAAGAGQGTAGAVAEVEAQAAGVVTFAAAAGRAKAELWHKRLGHLNYQSVKRLAQTEGTGVELPAGSTTGQQCLICPQAKAHRQPHPVPAAAPIGSCGKLGKVHGDWSGPVEPEGMGGWRWPLVLVDNDTRRCWVYFGRQRTAGVAVTCLQSLVANVAVPAGVHLRQLHFDNAQEFRGTELREYCARAGIALSYSAPYSPDENGVAERQWRTLYGMARCMLLESGLPKVLWPEAMWAAAYISNRCPHAALQGVTPYEAWHGSAPNLSNLRVWGAYAFVHVDSPDGKLGERGWRGRVVGYSKDSSGWRIYNEETRRVLVSKHVTFVEGPAPSLPPAGAEQAHVDVEVLPADQIMPPLQAMPQELLQQPAAGPAPLPALAEELAEPAPPAPPAAPAAGRPGLRDVPRRYYGEGAAARARSVPAGRARGAAGAPREASALLAALAEAAGLEALEPDAELYAGVRAYAAACPEEWVAMAAAAGGCSPDPTSYNNACGGPDGPLWRAAAEEEFRAVDGAGTWELLPESAVPAGHRILRTLWVFKTKFTSTGEVARRKARVVVDGSGQQLGVDCVQYFAPVVQLTSLRVAAALAAQHGWLLRQVDVDNAFVTSPVEEEVYVRQPQGFNIRGPNGERLVYKLRRSLYGLKQAPRNFHTALVDFLRQKDFAAASTDPCVLVCAATSIILLIYVDDILITGTSNQEAVDELLELIKQRFPIKDLGELHWFLGIAVVRDLGAGTVALSQERYIQVLLERFGMEQAKGVATPGVPGDGAAEHPMELLSTEQATLFRSLVGGLLYISVCTRPDLSYCVSVLARSMAQPHAHALTGAKRVLRYLKENPFGIVYRRTAGELVLTGYADASYAADVSTRKSTTGWVLVLAGAAVAWKSKLQPVVATSTTEAEYVALCYAALECVALRALLEFLGFPQRQATVFYEDNTAALQLSVNPVAQQATKHIAVRFHKLRELVATRVIDVTYVRTSEQLADILTKALGRVAHRRLAVQLLGRPELA